MKLSKKLLSGILLLAVAALTFSSCSKKKHDTKPTPRKVSYQVTPYENSGFTGTIKFTEILNSDSVNVLLSLKGDNINQYINFPVVINKGSALEEGSNYLTIGTFKGDKKKGTLDKDIKMSFDKVAGFDGGVTIFSSGSKDGVVAHAEIGINETFKAFDLKDNLGEINGQFRVYKRDEDSYLVIKIDTAKITESCKGNEHPAGVYNANGVKDFDLSPVNKTSGISKTTLTGKAYKDLIKYDGEVKILCSEDHKDVDIAKGVFK